MNKYLIFRTDRIGDFLLSLILINCIKRNDPKSYIVIVCSQKNYDYIKTFNIVDKIFELKNTFFSKLSIVKKLKKFEFDYSIILDGKRRSSLINFFLKKNKTIKISNNNISISHFKKIKNIIETLKYNFEIKDLNILEHRNLVFKHLDRSDYIIFHFDEKWSSQTYISNYKNIEPSEIQLLQFLLNLKSKLNVRVIITTGLNTPTILKNIISKISDNQIEVINNLNFLELEYLVSNSKLLISCHGSVSHVAAAHQIKQIDIIDTNIKNPYSNWTDHFRNYNSLFREDFNILSKKILNLL